MINNLSFLTLPLPSDIQMLYECGHFDEMNRLIEQMLRQDNIPAILRKRLEYTQIWAEDVHSNYQLTPDEVLARIQEKIPDFTSAELDRVTDERTLDWRFVDGEKRYRNNCISNLMKTRLEYATRETDQVSLHEKELDYKELDNVMHAIQQDKKVRYHSEIELNLTISSDALELEEPMRIWLPKPVLEDPVKDCRLISSSHTPMLVSGSACQQPTYYFELPYFPDMQVSVTLEWDTEMTFHDLHPDMVTADLPAADVTPDDLAELEPHIRFTPALRALAKEIVGDETNPLLKARRIYDFITTKCTYRFMPTYRSIADIPGYFCSNLRGDCGVQALTFITLCRLSGVPARWQSGIYTSPRSSGNHDWARFYVAPYGWLFADCSFGGSAYRAGNMERHNFYFGHLDPWRLPFASAFQQAFDPPMQFPRYDPYDNQNGEAESLHRRLYSNEIDHSRTLLVCTRCNQIPE